MNILMRAIIILRFELALFINFRVNFFNHGCFFNVCSIKPLTDNLKKVISVLGISQN